MISRNAQIAIAALMVLAKDKQRLSATDIASSSGISHPSIAKILSALRHGGFIASTPGPGGGSLLTRPPNQITILDICHYFDTQTSISVSCAIDCGCNNATPCAIHVALREVEHLRDRTLGEMTIEQLATH